MKNEMKAVQKIGHSEFETEVLHSRRPVLVSFITDWSKPCQLLGSVLEEVAETCCGKIKVLTLNVDDNPDLGNLYGVQSVPTLTCFINGTVRIKIVGMASSKAILEKLQTLVPGIASTDVPKSKGI